MLKTILKILLKIGGGGYIIYYLLYKVHWIILPNIIQQINPYILLFATTIYFSKYLIEAYKWFIVNTIYEVKIPYYKLLKYKIIGPAFDFITPLPQGEDVYKFYMLKSRSITTTASIAIPILIRFSGLLAIAIFFPFTIWEYKKYLQINTTYITLSNIALALFIVMVITVTLDKMAKRFEDFVGAIKTEILIIIGAIKKDKVRILLLIITSLASHLSYVSFVWLLCNSMGINIKFTIILYSLPLIYFTSLLPIVTGGIGVKEAVIIWILTMNGINIELIQGVALTHLLTLLLFILLGFLLLLSE